MTNFNSNLIFKYENVIVGSVTDKGLTTMTIEQTYRGQGQFKLDVFFSHCSIEVEEQIDIESLVSDYIVDARYDGDKAKQVLDWLFDFGENVHDLPYVIQRECDSDSGYKGDVLNILGVDNPMRKFTENNTLFTHNHTDGDVYHLVEIMPIGEGNVFGIKSWSHLFPMLFSYANVYNGKTYDETIATKITELVQGMNTDSELVFEEYMENKF